MVYLPLLLPALVAGCAGTVARRLDPRLATWVLTVSAVLLAAASGLVLAALAATALGQVSIVAHAGDWSIRVLRRHDPTGPLPAALAGALLVAALTGLVTVAVRRALALRDTTRTARRLPGPGSLAVLDDPAPHAFTLPGRPGRIVVSTGLLRALDPAQRKALLAHERAHLRCSHHVFVLVTQVAAATNPLLRPAAKAVGYTVERWADEHAARVVGDRLLTASALAKAAELTGMGNARRITERISALHATPRPAPRRTPALLLVATVAALLVATFAAAQTARDVHTAFHIAVHARTHAA